ncbi:MAG TPA: S8 family peptidase [Gemmatimonadaceae bacterium]
MKLQSFALSLATLAALAACSSPPVTTATAPAPVPTTAPAAPAASTANSTVIPPTRLGEAPRDWQLLDEDLDHVPGVSANRAMKELLAGQQPKRTVVVAVIDGGIDTAHVDLRPNLWSNPRETPANGVDDDRNGYADDVRGWNFIGGRDGRDVYHDTFEVTRLYAQCQHGGSGPNAPQAAATDDRCKQITADFEHQRSEINDELQGMRGVQTVVGRIVPILREATHTDSLTVQNVRALNSSSPEVAQARQIFLQLAAEGATPQAIDESVKALENQSKYSLDPSFDPRSIVGDNYADPTQRIYGNNDVMGQDAMHGTHVAGIIGAVRGNGIGIDGIAPAVKLMMVRTVPDGDERDKDVANAIRYAVDNGANVINMSFGKGYSPYKGAVDEAVRYADAHGVLMIHAAGNDGADIGVKNNFPTPAYQSGGRPQNWIEVGASSWKGGDSLVASFSNYNQQMVDLFAPGVDILSTVPGNGYARESGTSMAAPVVTGVAALLMDYFPSLTAADVRHILITSARRYPRQQVLRPGEGSAEVPFGTLSATGAIVNAYEAVKAAQAARP